VRTLGFVVLRRLLGLVGLGPAPDTKDVEIAVLRHVRHEALLFRMGVRDRPSPWRRSGGVKLEAA
jgi:hypothetical protein